nr:unnamed protein product [Callosobruchus analis]
MRENIERLLLLHCKYWLLQIRSPGTLICTFACPILTALLLCCLRYMGEPKLNEKEIYEPFCVSPNPVPFLCSLNSTKSPSGFDDLPKRYFLGLRRPVVSAICLIGLNKNISLSVYVCCKSKEVSNYVCIVCSNVYHKSCCARKKGVMFVDKHKIYCSKKCQLKADEEEHIDVLRNPLENAQQEIEDRDKFIDSLKKKNLAFEDDIDIETSYTSEIENNKSMINKLERKLDQRDKHICALEVRLSNMLTENEMLLEQQKTKGKGHDSSRNEQNNKECVVMVNIDKEPTTKPPHCSNSNVEECNCTLYSENPLDNVTMSDTRLLNPFLEKYNFSASALKQIIPHGKLTNLLLVVKYEFGGDENIGNYIQQQIRHYCNINKITSNEFRPLETSQPRGLIKPIKQYFYDNSRTKSRTVLKTVKTSTFLFYSPDNPQLAKVMNIYKVFGYEVTAKRNADELVVAFKVHANTTMAGIQFDDSYSSIADLKDIKNAKVSIRFPAELRHPVPSDSGAGDVFAGGEFWDTEKKFAGDVGGPRNPKSSIGGNPSMAGRDSYIEDAIGYVQVKPEGIKCIVKCRATPEHKVKSKPYHCTLVCDENDEKIESVLCHDCAAKQGG